MQVWKSEIDGNRLALESEQMMLAITHLELCPPHDLQYRKLRRKS